MATFFIGLLGGFVGALLLILILLFAGERMKKNQPAKPFPLLDQIKAMMAAGELDGELHKAIKRNKSRNAVPLKGLN